MFLNCLNLSLIILKMIGFHPKYNSWKDKLKSTIVFISSVIVLITVIVEICRMELTIVNIAPLLEAFGAAIEVSIFDIYNIFKTALA